MTPIHKHRCKYCKSAWLCKCARIEVATTCWNCLSPEKVEARERIRRKRVLEERNSGVPNSLFKEIQRFRS